MILITKKVVFINLNPVMKNFKLESVKMWIKDLVPLPASYIPQRR